MTERTYTPEEVKALHAMLGDAPEIELVSNAQKWETTGQYVIGSFIRRREVHTKLGEADIVELNPVDGSDKVGVFLTVALREWFDKIKPEVGDVIGIIYLGEQDRLKRFRAFLHGQDEDVPF